MDNLDILKKEWQSREHDLPKVSYNDIYKMLLKKSSSIVKWIFVISVAELLFWISIQLVIPEKNMEIMNEMGIGDILFYSNFVHFSVFAIFIYFFYRNFKSIQVTDNTKMLMMNILKTRSTVKYFVYYNVGIFILSSIVVDFYFYSNSGQLFEIMDFASQGMSQESFASIFIISQIVVGIIVLGLLILFYWLVYGFLLRKLNRNYIELKKMED